jgi:starvation-inducible DNA-binding protein
MESSLKEVYPATRRLRFHTKNDLPEYARQDMVALMNRLLADALDLQSQCKQAHWNVKGHHFFSLHLLFDRVHGAVSEYADLLAERAAQLGGTAFGTVRAAAAASRLSEYPLSIVDGSEHVEALSSALAEFGKAVRESVEEAEKSRDADTADILIEISRGADKWLWMVESHQTGAGR